MKVNLIGCFLCLLFVGASQAANWALLIASSNGWTNYRHQADVCHAYQVLKARGFPEDKIVVMMYDDIAYNPKNPLPGQIINQPNGTDVYKGVKIDYRGMDITPKNFLKVLSGQKDAMMGIGTGRVIESTPEDSIFVYFVDHGGIGMFLFPYENLYADALENTLTTMSKNNQFKQMLFYVEACEAGTMFDNILEENHKILVITASATDEKSWGYYCDEEQFDSNCLGDLFSISWIEHLEQVGNNEDDETIFHNYAKIRTRVYKSHVQLYGDFSVGTEHIKNFFGSSSKSATKNPTNIKYRDLSAVPSRDISLHVAQKTLEQAPPSKKLIHALELTQLYQTRKISDQTFETIIRVAIDDKTSLLDVIENTPVKLDKKLFPCYKELIQAFEKYCFNISENEYVVRHLYKFVNLCGLQDIPRSNVIRSIQTVCHKTV